MAVSRSRPSGREEEVVTFAQSVSFEPRADAVARSRGDPQAGRVRDGGSRHRQTRLPGLRRIRAGGVVTSGTHTPFLDKGIGLAYLPTVATTPGTECAIEIRGRRVAARVVPLPFYKRG